MSAYLLYVGQATIQLVTIQHRRMNEDEWGDDVYISISLYAYQSSVKQIGSAETRIPTRRPTPPAALYQAQQSMELLRPRCLY